MSKKIVLIDAEKANRQLFRQAFDEIGAEVDCTYADCCSEGAAMIKKLQPDAMFIQLDPDITDALEFVREVKRSRRLRNIPTIVYSANMYHYNFLARGHGADLCMVFPPTREEIKKVLEDFWIARELKPKLRLF